MKIQTVAMLTVLFVGIISPTMAQNVAPIDAELRTAYCVPVLQQETGEMQSGINAAKVAGAPLVGFLFMKEAEAALAKTEDTLHRLQAYLVPRMNSLDPLAVAAAMNRGRTDIKSLRNAQAACQASTHCTPIDIGLFWRTQSCDSPTWLPF